jgi:endonuclease G, mitochondrial
MKRLFASLLLIVTVNACDFGLLPKRALSEHLELGNPSLASKKDPNNYLLIKEQFVVSYNRTRLTANWVAWHLDNNWIRENTERQGNFHSDEELPAKWKRALPSMYLRSGFDRGHLCPAGDRTRTVKDQEATFVMTNIIPQAPLLNRGLWVEIEKECRRLVRDGKELYIYSGTEAIGGIGENGYAELLIGGIYVPGYVWKVIVVLPEGSRDASRINENTQVISLLIPNRDASSQKTMDEFVVTLQELEKKTRLDFLPDNYGVETLKQKKYNFKGELLPNTGQPCGLYNQKSTYKGAQGGCYYLNSSGNKVYVEKEFCDC